MWAMNQKKQTKFKHKMWIPWLVQMHWNSNFAGLDFGIVNFIKCYINLNNKELGIFNGFDTSNSMIAINDNIKNKAWLNKDLNNQKPGEWFTMTYIGNS